MYSVDSVCGIYLMTACYAFGETYTRLPEVTIREMIDEFSDENLESETLEDGRIRIRCV